MGWASAIDKTLGGWNAMRGSEMTRRGIAVAKDVAGRMHLASAGFATRAGLSAAAGGGAGYLYGDGDWGTAAKGAGLGVLGATAYRGVRAGRASSLLRSEAQAAKGAIVNRQRSLMDKANTVLSNNRELGGTSMSSWSKGQRGPASHWWGPGQNGPGRLRGESSFIGEGGM
jgi:hypothetical protein